MTALLMGLLAPLMAVSQPPAATDLGKNLIIAVEGRKLSKQQAAFLAEFRPGGVVLLGGNISSRAQTSALTQAIKQAVGGGTDLANYPLVYVDQEGGRINRLRLDGAPSAAALGRLNDGEAARETGVVFAREAAARGIGVVLAPVLDLCPAGSGGVI
ncbi:MAG TPA: glycoside hydrolase family 3 N-terminal domain-containing protein, partial [Candidatus Hydrogenedentes bacterium]|nr:glycoside hydrolase family 3 N-terminal domain-containing protein [Candidatus Hydrogenedentota bacterium]